MHQVSGLEVQINGKSLLGALLSEWFEQSFSNVSQNDDWCIITVSKIYHRLITGAHSISVGPPIAAALLDVYFHTGHGIATFTDIQ